MIPTRGEEAKLKQGMACTWAMRFKTIPVEEAAPMPKQSISDNLEVVTHLGIQPELNLDTNNENGCNHEQLEDQPVPKGKRITSHRGHP